MPTISSACDFMMSLGKPQLCAKFEIASLGCRRNINGEPQNFGEHLKTTLFFMGAILWWALANSSCVPNLKLQASAVAVILIGNPQIFGSFPSARPRPLFPLIVVFMEGLGQPQLHAKFEVAGFISYGNIRESAFKRQICFLSHPFRELRVMYGSHL